jgi:hypothetical protein
MGARPALGWFAPIHFDLDFDAESVNVEVLHTA